MQMQTQMRLRVVRNQAVQVEERSTLSWKVSQKGNRYFEMSGRRVLTVFKNPRKPGKWNYAVQLQDGTNHYENDFASEAEALRHAEETFGDQAVRPEGPTPRTTRNLRVVPKEVQEVEVVKSEPEPEPEPQVQLEEIEEKNSEPLSATGCPKEDYISAYLGQSQTPWGKVLGCLSGGDLLPTRTLALRADLSVEDTIKYLKSYDPEMVNIVTKDDQVKLTWTEKFYDFVNCEE